MIERLMDEPREPFTPEELEAAAKGWDNLADDEVRRLDWDKYAEPSGCLYRANVYRRTAQSIRMEIETGIAVCSCCFKPLGSGLCSLSRNHRAI